jgi:hypothetical protein
MDWLRSEDLKEEKVVTTPAATIPRLAAAVPCTKLACARFASVALLALWIRSKPRSNRPKQRSPKPSRKWRSRELLLPHESRVTFCGTKF